MQSKVTALKRETALIFLAHTNLMCFEWIPKEMIGLFCRLSTYRMSSDFWISINSMEQLIFNLSTETFPKKDIAQSIEYAKMLDVQRPPISHLKHCFYPIYFQFHSVNKMHTPKDNTKRTETELHRNRNQITFYYTHTKTQKRNWNKCHCYYWAANASLFLTQFVISYTLKQRIPITAYQFSFGRAFILFSFIRHEIVKQANQNYDDFGCCCFIYGIFFYISQ